MLSFQTLQGNAGLHQPRSKASLPTATAADQNSDFAAKFLDLIQGQDKENLSEQAALEAKVEPCDIELLVEPKQAILQKDVLDLGDQDVSMIWPSPTPSTPPISTSGEVSVTPVNEIQIDNPPAKADEPMSQNCTKIETRSLLNTQDLVLTRTAGWELPPSFLNHWLLETQATLLLTGYSNAYAERNYAQDQDKLNLSDKNLRRIRRQKLNAVGDTGIDYLAQNNSKVPEGIDFISSLASRMPRYMIKSGSGMDVMVRAGDEGLRVFAWASQLNLFQKEKLRQTMLEIVSRYGYRLSDIAIHGSPDHSELNKPREERTTNAASH
jgi:hypothetical protein